MNNIEGFKEHVCNALTIEMSPVALLRLGPIIEHMHRHGNLKKVLGKRAHATQLQQGKQSAGNIITEQTNKKAQMKYVKHLSYINIPEVATMEKRVELRRLDDKDRSHASPVFVWSSSSWKDQQKERNCFIPCFQL